VRAAANGAVTAEVKPAAKRPIASDETTAEGAANNQNAERDHAAANDRHRQPPTHLLETAFTRQGRTEEEVVGNDGCADKTEDENGPTHRDSRHQQASDELAEIGSEANGGDKEGYTHDRHQSACDAGDPLCVAGRQQQGRRHTGNES